MFTPNETITKMKRIPKTNIYDVTIDISNPTKFHFRFIYIYQPCPAPCIYIAQTGAIQVILSRNCSWLEGVVLSKNPVTNAFILRKFSSVDLYKQSALLVAMAKLFRLLPDLARKMVPSVQRQHNAEPPCVWRCKDFQEILIFLE